MEALVRERRPRVRPMMGAALDKGVQSICSLSMCEQVRPHGSLMWGCQCLPNGVSKPRKNSAGVIQGDDLQSQHYGSMEEEETEIRAGWQTLLPR